MIDLDSTIEEMIQYYNKRKSTTSHMRQLNTWINQLEALNAPKVKEITIDQYTTAENIDMSDFESSDFGMLDLDVIYENEEDDHDAQIVIWGEEKDTRALANQIINFFNKE